MATKNQTPLNSLEICSRCISHEISSWIFDKQAEINPDVMQKIREELKSIRMRQGKCIVCSRDFVSVDVIENINKIFGEEEVSQSLQEEFKNLFCLGMTA